MMLAVGSLLSMGVAEERNIGPFDFSNGLNQGETLTSALCVITVWNGVDTNPQSHLIAGPAIEGHEVSVRVGNFIVDVTYQILIVVNTSAGQILDMWALQYCYGP